MPVKSSKSLGVPPSRKERVSNLLGSAKTETVVTSTELPKELLRRVKVFLINSDEYKYQNEIIKEALEEFLEKREQD